MAKNCSYAFPVSKELPFRVPMQWSTRYVSLCCRFTHPACFSLSHAICIFLISFSELRPAALKVLCRVLLWTSYSLSSIANRCRHGTVELEGGCAPGLMYEDLPQKITTEFQHFPVCIPLWITLGASWKLGLCKVLLNVQPGGRGIQNDGSNIQGKYQEWHLQRCAFSSTSTYAYINLIADLINANRQILAMVGLYTKCT